MGNCVIHLKMILVKCVLGKGISTASCGALRGTMSGKIFPRKFLEIYPDELSQLFRSLVRVFACSTYYSLFVVAHNSISSSLTR
jgi:hypothetical protein